MIGRAWEWLKDFMWKTMVAIMFAWMGYIIFMMATGQWDMWAI